MKKFALYTAEIIIWLVAIYFIAQVTISTFYPQLTEYREYTVKLNDIDGLIVGSPVRLMGMQIGTVSKITYNEDKILLTMRIRKKGVNLPPSTTFTIEGASLGGNRSIELIPHEDQSEEHISIKEHKRMISMIKDANEAIDDMISGFVSMLEIVNTRTPKELEEKIAFFNDQLGEFDTLSSRINKDIEAGIKSNPENIRNIKTNLGKMVQTSSDPRLKDSIITVDKCLNSIQKQSKCMSEKSQTLQADKIRIQTQQSLRQMQQANELNEEETENILDAINAASEGINSFANSLNELTKDLKAKEKKD
ncbi:MAG TPA: MCE family protein [Candidatus Adamsella sp.]|nr:MCE family protein [Candidatus Adamsella sp.]